MSDYYTKHTCHALYCKKVIPPSLLMCPHHWKMVPEHIRWEIWKHYNEGQEVFKKPSRLYLAAARKAIQYVAQAEKFNKV